MTQGLIITGTDTSVGKTVVAAMLTQALGAIYWKPIQAGLDDETDTQLVQRLTGLPVDRIVPEAYRLNTPASPHLAAKLDGQEIAMAKLALPQIVPAQQPLIVEGAGGVMVPLRDDLLFIDLFACWCLPVIVCARTSLGGINHALLSLAALRAKDVAVFGIVFVGDDRPDTIQTICRVGKVKNLGRLPFLSPLNGTMLDAAFKSHFNIDDFIAPNDKPRNWLAAGTKS